MTYVNRKPLRTKIVGLKKERKTKVSLEVSISKASSNKTDSKKDEQSSVPEKNRSNSSGEDNTAKLEESKVFTKDEISKLLEQGDMKKIWKAQDTIIRKWPSYNKVREKLIKQLVLDIDLDNTPVQKLVEKALKSRKKFWEAGGALSQDSYLHVYRARILLEIAHNREPQNLEVTDELVETIQAAYPLFFFDEQTNKKIRRDDVDKALLELRSGQFEQIRKEVQQGRSPTRYDFIRAVDLGVILSIYDVAKAKEVVGWLQREAAHGGWNEYYRRLEEFQHYLNQGEAFSFTIYRFTNNTRAEIARYIRRYPSFRGPTPEKRGIILIGFND